MTLSSQIQSWLNGFHMLKRLEGTFKGFDEADLLCQVWKLDKPRGTIVLTHGIAEHSDCYHLFAKELAESGWEVWGWDLRGHGRSPGKRGFVRDFSDFKKDLFCLLNEVKKSREATGPIVLFGHSMGGLITIRMLQEWNPDGITALVLSAPAVGLALAVPRVKEILAKIAVNWAPGLTLHNEIHYEDLSRDPEMLAAYEKDPLRHDRICPALFLGMTSDFTKSLEEAKDMTWPTLVIHGGNDHIISAHAIRQFYDSLGSSEKEIHLYPDSLHEVLNDLDKDHAIKDITKFLNHFLKGNVDEANNE